MPLLLLILIALIYNPLVSNFVIANQECRALTDIDTVLASFINFRHIIGFGVIYLIAVLTFVVHRMIHAVIIVFFFSFLIEIEQSFFIEGHCRAWDLIPNLVGISAASVIVIVMKNPLRKIFGHNS